ncbi:MAG: MFS transporter [Conexivisphaerales archaeon]
MTVYGLSKKQWLQVFAAWSGWLMDGYTTIMYALLAVTLSTIMFPSTIGVWALVATFGGFAVGGVARSIGSLVLGNFLGDKLGRRNMLLFTVLGFSILSASKGLIPTYSSIGIAAPVILYVILWFEGMFAGAEYGGGTALSMESVPAERRSFIGSFVQSGYGTGYFVISFVLAAFTLLFRKDFNIVGWRYLFGTALIIGAMVLILRLMSTETKIFEEMVGKREISKVPLKDLFKFSPYAVIMALLITTGLLFVNTATFSFYPTVILLKGISLTKMSEASGIINLVSLFGVWIGGAIANSIGGGRKRPMLIYSVVFIVSIYPILYLAMHTTNILLIGTYFSIQAFLEAMIFSTLPALLSEQFSKKYRVTGVGFTYNGGAIVGAWAISLIVASSSFLGLLTSWFVWMLAFSIVMIIGVLLIRETWKKDQKEDLMER